MLTSHIFMDNVLWNILQILTLVVPKDAHPSGIQNELMKLPQVQSNICKRQFITLSVRAISFPIGIYNLILCIKRNCIRLASVRDFRLCMNSVANGREISHP